MNIFISALSKCVEQDYICFSLNVLIALTVTAISWLHNPTITCHHIYNKKALIWLFLSAFNSGLIWNPWIWAQKYVQTFNLWNRNCFFTFCDSIIQYLNFYFFDIFNKLLLSSVRLIKSFIVVYELQSASDLHVRSKSVHIFFVIVIMFVYGCPSNYFELLIFNPFWASVTLFCVVLFQSNV